MSSVISLLRDTILTVWYIPPAQLVALARHRLGVLRSRFFGNPWPVWIESRAEKEWPEAHLRSLSLQTPTPQHTFEDLLSRWRFFQDGKLVLLNREETFTPGALWESVDDPSLPPLVAETFHYHQFLASFSELLAYPETTETDRAEILASLTSLLEDWWTRYPVGQQPGWGAFAVAFRIRSWLWLYRILGQCRESQAWILQETLEKRLFSHGLYLEQNLECHLGGNHLFKDLCAIALLASFFEGPTAARWAALITRELPRQIKIQILPDGGHYERSPMYHCLVLNDLLDIVEYLMEWHPSWVMDNLLEPVHKMATFLAEILHPDGDIPLFNDSVLGQEETLCRGRVGVLLPLSTFPDTGLTRIHQGDLTCIIDHGRLGPDELMGHVHNDTLSFELSVGTERFIVDKGVYEYTAGARRTESRAIHSHNTPSVEGFEQAGTWASFRVARRWHIQNVKVTTDPGEIMVSGEWARPGMGWIAREVRCEPVGSLVIRDEIRCDQPRPCQIPFLFASGIAVTVRMLEGDVHGWYWEARSGAHTLCGWSHSTSPLRVTVEDSVTWPKFYTELPSSRLVIRPEVQVHTVVFTHLAANWDALKDLLK